MIGTTRLTSYGLLAGKCPEEDSEESKTSNELNNACKKGNVWSNLLSEEEATRAELVAGRGKAERINNGREKRGGKSLMLVHTPKDSA